MAELSPQPQAPFVDELLKIVGQLTVEVHLLASRGMAEAQRLGMKSLARTQLKAILYIGLV